MGDHQEALVLQGPEKALSHPPPQMNQPLPIIALVVVQQLPVLLLLPPVLPLTS